MTPKLEDADIYAKSGDVDKHLEGVKKQYDTKEKLAFYEEVMGDGTNNIHFGKWDGVDLEEEGAYGKASDQMTHYMFDLSMSKLGGSTDKVSYVDLGSGTGAAAMLLLQKHGDKIEKATCLNLCNEQNALATSRAKELGVSEKMSVVTGTYEDAPLEDNSFHIAFSQDAFVHAFSKLKTFQEALRITKPGGVLVFCDLMCGNGPDVTDEELATFAQTNMVNDWLSPEQNVQKAQEAGWTNVEFINLTGDIRISFQLMLKKVERIVSKKDHGIPQDLLDTYQQNLTRRITQVDRGVFQWGVIIAKKAD